MRGWDAGVQGSRKRGEHTLDCVKHRGSRWRGEFVFKKLPLPPSLPLSLTLSSLLSPCSATATPFFFFSSSSCLTPSPSLVLAYRIFSAYPYPFHPTWLYSSATEDDLRDNSHRALLDPRARFSFLPSPFYLFFSFLFFFLFFSFPFFSSFLSFPFSPTSSSSSSSSLLFFPSLFSTGSVEIRARHAADHGQMRGSRVHTRKVHACSTPRNEKARVRG